MIVITSPSSVVNEHQIIQQLFEEGLVVLHIRKPTSTAIELKAFISKIDSKYHSRLVLHQHHILAMEFNIKRLHFTEKARINIPEYCQKREMILSTSVHSIEDFNNLSDLFDYAFLSPVYPSLSKENYKPTKNVFETIINRKSTQIKLIALGGISAENIQKTLLHFDAVALLGTIWKSTNPLENFKKCQTNVLSL